MTACQGTCTSEATSTCQVDCQTTQWERCQTTIRERCTTSCEDKGGAIFCNGQFLNAAKLDDCASELSAKLSIKVDLDIDIDTQIDTNGDGESESVSCSFAPTSSSGAALWGVAGLAALGLMRRRRS